MKKNFVNTRIFLQETTLLEMLVKVADQPKKPI